MVGCEASVPILTLTRETIMLGLPLVLKEDAYGCGRWRGYDRWFGEGRA